MQLGKPTLDVMAKTVFQLKGRESGKVLVGPNRGVDVSVVGIGKGQVMVASCDPISFIPSLGPRDSALMSVHEVASDVATSGIAPRFAMFDLNLPPHVSNSLLSSYWKSVHETCKSLGLSIVGGHTGRFEGCDYSVIGGAAFWTFCQSDRYLTSAMASDGDDLILTKTAAYGATAVLSRVFPRRVRRFLGPSLFREAARYLPRMNTVNDSLTAVKVGIHGYGVTAIHDVTEGGVYAAVLEMANASAVGGIVDVESIPVSEETSQVSKLFRIDPLTSLGEGSLVIASRPDKTKHVMDRLRSNDVQATVIGQFSSRVQGVRGREGNRRARIRYPARDPYWQAYSRGLRKGWN
ncbi:hypothetical protein E6H22_03950 [Candidatus Bathyarchaeota archaeon]|nr:MAG: hypothetical protein E6H22_03950 [Candidatus Bathyarchaeota archaeon]